MERRRSMVDGLSRALSVLTIVLGGGLLLFLFQENKTLRQEVTELKKNVTDTSDLINLAKDFETEWDSFNKFKTDVDGTISDAEEGLESLRRVFLNATDQLSKDRMELAKSNEALANLQAVVAAKLQVAEKRMKVGPGDGGSSIYVNNEGLAAAEIRSVEFFPNRNGQFRTTSADNKAAVDCLTDGKTFVIEFSKNDNQSASKNKELHGNYLRTYAEVDTPKIPGQQTVPVAILIQNSEHIGWGWEGSLEVTYADGQSLQVPSVRAIFSPDTSDKT